MTQDTKTFDAKLERRNGSELLRRRIPEDDFFLTDEEFRFATACERMRVDRNGSVLSLLLVRLHQQPTEDPTFFARVLKGRLRVTDTPGHFKDGRVAILLPDTSAKGAWKVAADISEAYPPGPSGPECEVLVYLNDGRGRDDNSAEDYDESSKRPEDSEKEVAASRVDDGLTSGLAAN